MKKIGKLLVCILLTIIMVACGSIKNSSKEENHKTDVGITEKESSKDDKDIGNDYSSLGTVKIGMDGETPGYTEIDKNGDVIGVDVDIWKEIARRSNFKVEFKVAAFSSLFEMLESERIDAVGNFIGKTEEREKRYLFSEPYIYDENVLIAKAGKSINNIKDLDGWSIAVEPASMDEEIVNTFEKENGIKLNRVFYDGLAIQDVALGRVDLWLKSESGAKDVVRELGEDKIQIIAGTGVNDTIAYPLSRSERGKLLKEAVDKSILEMQKDGSLSKIANKYLETDPTVKSK